MFMDKCTDIVLLEHSDTVGDVLNVTINGDTTALWFYSYAEALKFVGKEVIVEYRKDMYNGVIRQFIATFTIPTVITTLDKKEGFKLYVDQVDNFASLSFNEIADGETAYNCVVFCTAQEFCSSGNAVWLQLTIRDKTMHTATLRLFNYDNSNAEFAGKYINTELSRSKYGFKSDQIVPMNKEVLPNPEIEIARQYILNYFANDAVAYQYINKTNIIDYLSVVVDYELGYGLMRLAMELAMVDSMENITKDVDLTTIGRALLVSRGHYSRESVLSGSVNNVVLAMGYPWENKQLLLQIIDEALEQKPKEYLVMKSIKSTVDTILTVRKGTVFGRDT